MPSSKLYTIEYSSLTDMVNHDSTAGAKVELTDVGGSDVVLGVYNSGSEDDHRTSPNGCLAAQISDLPQLNGDWGVQAKVSRDLWTAPERAEASGSGLDKVRAGLWWFHAENSKDSQTAGLDTNFEEFTNIVSFNTEFHAARWGVFTDFVFANVDPVKDDDTDLHGLVLMPYYDVTSKWQLAYRYTRMWGGYDEEDRLAGRGLGADMDTRLRTGSGMVEGDTFSSHYLGVNYFICGHKLKLQFGLEHIGLEDPRPAATWGNAEYWSYQSAVKMYF
jgi:hypothetical protein